MQVVSIRKLVQRVEQDHDAALARVIAQRPFAVLISPKTDQIACGIASDCPAVFISHTSVWLLDLGGLQVMRIGEFFAAGGKRAVIS